MNNFWGYDDIVDIFCGSSQNWTSFRGNFYVFSYGKCIESDYFFWGGGCKNF